MQIYYTCSYILEQLCVSSPKIIYDKQHQNGHCRLATRLQDIRWIQPQNI